MKTNELRVGNWLERLDGSAFQVDELDFQRLLSIDENLHPKAILITKDWIEKFGFEWSIQHQAYYLQGLGYVLYDCGDYWGVIKHRRNGEFLISVTNVHTLQNLYFILTGEELEIKE
jgi:hypothetical protein